MGTFAEDIAREYQFTARGDGRLRHRLAHPRATAQASGAFDREIVPVEVAGRKGSTTVTLDEQPARGDVAKIPTLKAAFAKDGAITAANFLLQLGWCGGAGDDAPVGRRPAGPDADRTRRRARRPCARAGAL